MKVLVQDFVMEGIKVLANQCHPEEQKIDQRLTFYAQLAITASLSCINHKFQLHFNHSFLNMVIKPTELPDQCSREYFTRKKVKALLKFMKGLLQRGC